MSTDMAYEDLTSNDRPIFVSRLDKNVAITTPVSDDACRISKKTPVFHLPVYEVEVGTQMACGAEGMKFHCDLADLTDLIDRLKSYKNQWQRYGR